MLHDTFLLDFKKSLHVLLVEDNQEARLAIYDLLSNFFDTIVTATNGKHGLEQFQSQKFDLIITDINMPIMNGLEMIAKIKENHNNIPIIILSAHQDSQYLLESITYSVDAYILKPVDVTQLVTAVDKVANNLFSLQKNREYEQHLERLVEAKTKELLELSNRDPMTGLYNRRYFNDISSTLINLTKRNASHLSTLMIDLDRFKAINDNYGHLIGDEIIKLTAKILLISTRNSDLLIRFGGEEFVVLLIDTDLDGAQQIAQKIRKSIEEQKFETPHGEVIAFTLSIGIALFDAEIDSEIDYLIHRSDKALYEAKRAGRNQVVVYEKQFPEQESHP